MNTLLSLAPTGTDEAEPTEPDLAQAQAAETTSDDALPLDVSFDILQNARRRQTLHLVMAAEDGTTLADISERIAAQENDKPRSQLGAQERKRVYVGLYQCHLPRMDEAGVVAFDEDRGSVEQGPHAEELYQYLETATEEEKEPATSPPLCGALGGVAGVLLTAAVAYAAPVALPAIVGIALVGAGAGAAHQLRGPPQ